MGNDSSQPVHALNERLAIIERERRALKDRDKELFQILDQRTKVPHLLIELRSLGYVEICGKDTGGIYARLSEWLEKNWGCKPVTHESKEAVWPGMCGGRCRCRYNTYCSDLVCGVPFSDYLTCGCGGTPCICSMACCNPGRVGNVVLMEERPLLEHDRLCDAIFAMPKARTPLIWKWLSKLECDQHHPCCCWYCTRCCCKCTVPQPEVFRLRGWSGENNMGKLTMQLVNFMTNQCGWSLVLCNGTNLGFYGEIREQQIKFAAPHPLNLVAPHIMVELRTVGFIEVNGPDTDGIHDKLSDWFQSTFKAKPMKADPDFCDLKFKCSAFRRRGFEGENNMGQCTMWLVDFMTKSCAWTLVACNGGNFGRRGDLREQQLVFRNDAHVQHGEDHVMVELRDVSGPGLISNGGYVELNGIESSPDIEAPLDEFLTGKWGCKVYTSHVYRSDPFCEKKYRVPPHFFYRAPKLTNDMGKRTIELATFMASQGWMLLLCNGGCITQMKSRTNRFRARSTSFRVGKEFQGQIKREQQLKFTKAPDKESANAPLLMVEIRAVPRDPEVENIPYCIGPRCGCGEDKITARQRDYMWTHQTAKRRRTRRDEIRCWLAGGNVVKQMRFEKGSLDRESCVFDSYRLPAWSSTGAATGRSPRQHVACGTIEGLIEVNGPDTHGVYKKLEDFIVKYMDGSRLSSESIGRKYCDALFRCEVLRMKRVPFPASNPEIDGYFLGENNLGIYSMRLCDYLVDHLGEWDLVVCNGNALERQWKVDRDRAVSLCAREQQLVFRHRTGKARRNVFMAKQVVAQPLGYAPLEPPEYWASETTSGHSPHKLVTCTPEEAAWLQEMVDGTFKTVVTRDRKATGSILAEHFEVVSAMRSEHPALWDRYAKRRKVVADSRGLTGELVDQSTIVTPITTTACLGLAERSFGGDGPGGQVLNDANEAYLFHGTNPTSAFAILGTSFKVDFAGGAAGTMFGPGVYLAESSSKSDEYAQDDTEGAYKGLFAMLVCRAVIGVPYVVEQPGNYMDEVVSGSYDSVVGDREKAVGTYREFIFFHEAAVYPEYVIFYRREGNCIPGKSSAVCKFFLAGRCKYGDKCRYRHPEPSTSPSAPAAPAHPSAVPPAVIGAAAAPAQQTMQ
mmetsp:Transcript_75871/g.180267  ORF Transcript_75871/g.180267 Transcript_75871/m.180267 type:complete len:1130 (+) Transcript_75871:72-3461(+)